MASPRRSSTSSSHRIINSTTTSSTLTSGLPLPVTPRARASYPIARSPLESPSISASLPFDWEAVRGLRDPPYFPLGPKRRNARKSDMGTPNGKGTPTQRAVRKKSFYEKLVSLPSRVAFEISIFPNNVPLPPPKISAYLIGGILHIIHFCIRITQIRSIPDSDIGWEDMYREDNNVAWFDWTVPMTCLLIVTASLNTLFLFTHTKLYHLHLQPDPVASPHARFVSTSTDPPSLATRLRIHSWNTFLAFWRFLLGISPSSSSGSSAFGGPRVQELEVWTPSEGELMLFCVYSPIHVFLWMLWNAGNWIMMAAIMLGVSFQVRVLTTTYEALLKDRAIIAAEVLHEYDAKFVSPRIYPVRRDACVMTNEAEIVDHTR
ncbi:hypothetical protein B0F90DRAFT_1808237 [Multifurca ochricompacta]|uniref:Nuclear rim protein 1 n=1 Tax=Multifurca ochricompacta TaxID=376703 RepID=A0AAD4QP71_9AGAM|nr:hypothetical protein B0F90DRAFT_1808237 [Multifurca ochricompacta]